MRWFVYYLMGEEINGIVFLFFFGFLSLAATSAASSGARNAEVQEECYAVFEAQGLSEREVWEVSDREVLKVCGLLPSDGINRVWRHIYRNEMREQGIGTAGEFLNCLDDLKAEGIPEEDVGKVSKKRLVEVCGVVPAFLR